MTDQDDLPELPLEIAVMGELTEHEPDLCEKLLAVPPGGECTLYFNSPGGSAYAAMSLASILKLRNIQATGVVTGECSSAALWPFAACTRRLVTPHSVALFHPMKWESEEHVGIAEAAEWARHFSQLEKEMDVLLAELFGVPLDLLAPWMRPGRYVSGRELAAAGLAELTSLTILSHLQTEPPAPKTAKKPKSSKRA